MEGAGPGVVESFLVAMAAALTEELGRAETWPKATDVVVEVNTVWTGTDTDAVRVETTAGMENGGVACARQSQQNACAAGADPLRPCRL